VAGSGFGAPPGGGDAVGGGVFRLFNCPRFCSADWFVGDAADCSVKALLALPWAVASLGGLLAPVSWLFSWLITVILFSLAAALIDGFRLKNGLSSAVLGAVAYSVLSTVFIRLLGLGDVELIRAALA
jgi:hypothetical protein